MTRPALLLFASFAALLLGSVVYLLNQPSWRQPLAIGSGPPGSFQYAIAEVLDGELRAQGFQVTHVHRGDPLATIDAVQDTASPVNVGFVAQLVDSARYPGIVSLASVVRNPLFIFVRGELGGVRTPRDLEGLRLQVGNAGSEVLPFAAGVLREYGLGPENCVFLHAMPSAAVESVLRGEADAIFLLHPPGTAVVEDLARDPRLRLLDMPEAVAVASRLGYAQPVTVPPGIFDVARPIPAQQLNTVGIPLTVIARRELSDATVYAILQVLARHFDRMTSTGSPGEFPGHVDRQLPLDPRADVFFTRGLPREYRHLPRGIAEAVVPLLIIASAAMTVASLYKFFFPDVFRLWTGFLRPAQWERALARLEGAVVEGRPLKPGEKRMLRRILREAERANLNSRRLEAVRPLANPRPNGIPTPQMPPTTTAAHAQD